MRKRKKFEDALLYYDKSISMRPPDSVVYIQKASLLHELGRLGDQDKCYNRGLVFWPFSPHLLLAKGMMLKETHGNEHAIRYFEMALDVNPYHPETLTAMSNALKEQGMVAESKKFGKDRTVARRLIRKWEGSGAQFMLSDGSLAPAARLPKQEEKAISEIDRFDRALELDPGCIDMLTDKWEFMSREDDVDEMAFVMPEFDMHAANGRLSSTALILVTEKKYADAVEYCDKVLAVQPRMPHVLLYKGDALSGLGMHADALACYDRALAINPIVVDAVYGKGVILAQTGQHDAAADCFEVALEINPEHTDAHKWKRNLSKIMQSGKRMF